MVDFVREREDIINEINIISSNLDKKLEPLIKKLADNIANTLDRPEVIIWAKNEGVENPQKKDVITILLRLKKKNNWTIGRSSIYKYIQEEYKENYSESKENTPVRLTDNYLIQNRDDILERIREIEKGPAKDIRIKVKKDEIDLQEWNNQLSLELVLLAKKIHEEYDPEKQDEIIKEIAERVRMARDARFATTWAHYEGIVAAISASKSLTKAIEEEKYPLNRDEIIRNEHNCHECYCNGEPKGDTRTKCKCHCHRTLQEMTTKGLKWALKHNRKLGEFDEHFKRIGNMDHEDLCPHIKTMFTNPNMDKHLTQDDKLNMLESHIEREKCIRCEMFRDEHPDFFKIDG
jgi:hypothetical protein